MCLNLCNCLYYLLRSFSRVSHGKLGITPHSSPIHSSDNTARSGRPCFSVSVKPSTLVDSHDRVRFQPVCSSTIIRADDLLSLSNMRIALATRPLTRGGSIILLVTVTESFIRSRQILKAEYHKVSSRYVPNTQLCRMKVPEKSNVLLF